jgi:hypothetical protein
LVFVYQAHEIPIDSCTADSCIENRILVLESKSQAMEE